MMLLMSNDVRVYQRLQYSTAGEPSLPGHCKMRRSATGVETGLKKLAPFALAAGKYPVPRVLAKPSTIPLSTLVSKSQGMYEFELIT